MPPSRKLAHTLTTFLLTLVALLMLSAALLAQSVGYAVNDTSKNLFRIDLATGTTTLVGPTGFPGISSLSFGPDGLLYGVDDITNQLVIVNTTTGAATLVGNLGVNVTFGGLTFDLQGRLFLAEEGGGFYQINPQNGSATLLGNTGLAINGLAISPSGVIFAIANNDNLYTLNPANGAATLVGPLGVNYEGGGLDFAPNGALYGLSSVGVQSLFTVNPQTGQASVIAPIASNFESLAIRDEQFFINNPAVTDQKAGSVLVFPYYSSTVDGKASDTLIQISNVCNGASTVNGVANYRYLHLFFMKDCSPADTYACITPNGSLQILASVYDPGVTGYLIAVAVDSQGRPTQNNCFIGSAFVRDDVNSLADSYGAEAFRSNLVNTRGGAGLAPISNGLASINLDGVDYDAAPTQFSVQVQDPSIADESIVLASINGNLGTSLSATSQTGVGLLYRADEAPASFQPQIGTGCFSVTLLDKSKIRIVPGNYDAFLKDSYGYLKFNVSSPAVGLLISKQGASVNYPNNRFSGIRTLHKTQVGSATLISPIFPPFCVF